MFLEELKKKDIILASRSPRRKILLEALGIDFRIIVPDTGEDYPPGPAPGEVAIDLALRKARSVLNKLPDNRDIIVIASDTIVCLDDEILNKPEDRREAIEMLRKLSGRSHNVITGVSIASKEKELSFFSETKVNFTVLEVEEIEYYVDAFKPYDKAGSYGIQEWIGYVGIDNIEGSYFNVMGLPVQRLYGELKEFMAK